MAKESQYNLVRKFFMVLLIILGKNLAYIFVSTFSVLHFIFKKICRFAYIHLLSSFKKSLLYTTLFFFVLFYLREIQVLVNVLI